MSQGRARFCVPCCAWIAYPWENNFLHLCLGSISCKESLGRKSHFPGGCKAELISGPVGVCREGSGEGRVVISHL